MTFVRIGFGLVPQRRGCVIVTVEKKERRKEYHKIADVIKAWPLFPSLPSWREVDGLVRHFDVARPILGAIFHCSLSAFGGRLQQ